MKYLAGFAVSILVVLALSAVNTPPFLVGWISCMGYYAGRDVFEIYINEAHE
jgi:hypothetical protein